jgi:hypothetical protein
MGIHRSGCRAWSTPKSKFVTQIALRLVQVKKKKVATTIYAEETGGRQTNY